MGFGQKIRLQGFLLNLLYNEIRPFKFSVEIYYITETRGRIVDWGKLGFGQQIRLRGFLLNLLYNELRPFKPSVDIYYIAEEGGRIVD